MIAWATSVCVSVEIFGRGTEWSPDKGCICSLTCCGLRCHRREGLIRFLALGAFLLSKGQGHPSLSLWEQHLVTWCHYTRYSYQNKLKKLRMELPASPALLMKSLKLFSD